MSAFLTRCTVWLAVLLLFAVAGGLSAGAPGFWGVLATGLAGWLGFHLYHVALLLRWLRAPRPECIPEGLGSWQQVFSALYRQARQQQFHQKKLPSTLERFINAVEAMPDGVVVLDDSDRIEWINPMAVEHLGLDRQRDVGNLIANLVRQPGFHAFLTAEQHSQPLVLRLTQPHVLVLSVQLVPVDSTRKLLLPRTNLSELFPEAAARWLRGQGSVVRTGVRVRSVTAMPHTGSRTVAAWPAPWPPAPQAPGLAGACWPW